MMNWTEERRYCPGLCLEGLRKTMKNLNQDSHSLSHDLTMAPPEYETGAL
jgi:hypothetical protein